MVNLMLVKLHVCVCVKIMGMMTLTLRKMVMDKWNGVIFQNTSKEKKSLCLLTCNERWHGSMSNAINGSTLKTHELNNWLKTQNPSPKQLVQNSKPIN
jgi:23S rRNA A1618 N6-methylase RlmF